MKFRVGRKLFQIRFHRHTEMGERWDPEQGKLVQVPVSKPYTTVEIWKLNKKGDPTGKPYRTCTVGCYHKEKFTPEAGRMNALKLLCKTNSLPYQFKSAMWNAYMNRAFIQGGVADGWTSRLAKHGRPEPKVGRKKSPKPHRQVSKLRRGTRKAVSRKRSRHK